MLSLKCEYYSSANKLSLITAYITVNMFDIICTSETYLNSPFDGNFFLIPDYHLLRAGNPDNLKPIQGRSRGKKSPDPYQFFP